MLHNAAVYIYERDNSSKIDFLEALFWVDVGSPGVLQTRNIDHYIHWRNLESTVQDWFDSETLEGLIIEALAEVWGNSIEEILKFSNISSDDKEFETTVGYVDGKPVVFDNVDIMKKPKKK